MDIDAVTLEDVVQGFYQVVQGFWLHQLRLLHLFCACARTCLFFCNFSDKLPQKGQNDLSYQLRAAVYFL